MHILVQASADAALIDMMERTVDLVVVDFHDSALDIENLEVVPKYTFAFDYEDK